MISSKNVTHGAGVTVKPKMAPISFDVQAIGVVHSCYKEKFGIPRQPGLVPEAQAVIELLPPFNVPAAVEGLLLSSHIWVHFLFHANQRKQWKAKVKPPRLGGNKTLGVFATRSPVRPNPMGLSVVALTGIVNEYAGREGVFVTIAAHDLLDGTPVIDIKPYVPYADALPDARNDFAGQSPPLLAVTFTDSVALILNEQPGFKRLMSNVLAQDPRPAYKKGGSDNKHYGMRLNDWDIGWTYDVDCNGVEYITVVRLSYCL